MTSNRKMIFRCVGVCLFLAAIIIGSFKYAEYSNRAKDVINIYSWDASFREVLANYYPAYDREHECIGNVKVHWVIIPRIDGVYQSILDKALSERMEVTAGEQIDLFLLEADYVRKYTESAEVTESLNELGLQEQELQQQYAYTRRAAEDSFGVQRGIAYQACPGVMIYRRDIARKVFGTDDPDKIQELVRDWPAFEYTSDRILASGYHMLAGYFDTYRVFSNNLHSPWINEKKEIALPPEMKEWREQTRRFSEQGKNYPNDLWDTAWKAGVRGDVFCYFGTAWFIQQALQKFSLQVPVAEGGLEQKGNGTFGQWAVCQGPQQYYWGGSWICAAKGTKHKELIADIMRKLCCEPDTVRKIARGSTEFMNNRKVMQEIAQDASFGIPFLDGQNVYTVMAKEMEMETNRADMITPYDQGIHESFKIASKGYFQGSATADTAWQRFLATLWMRYPMLQNASVVR